MRHCCQFDASEIYYLADKNEFTHRKLSVGICPICNKMVAELQGKNSYNENRKLVFVGQNAKNYINTHKKEVIYSMTEYNMQKFQSKPFGWRYGINQAEYKDGHKCIQQYACDFYGNAELIKTLSKN